MQEVKDNEKDMVPGIVSAYDLLEAYMLGNGYFDGNDIGLYCRWNSNELKQIPIEETGEFQKAFELYKQLRGNDLLLDPGSRKYGTLLHNGQLGFPTAKRDEHS